MNSPQKQPSKRIVSKGEYVRMVFQQTFIGASGGLLLIVMVICGFAAIVIAVLLLPLIAASYFGADTSLITFLLLLFAIFLGVSAYYAGKWGSENILRSEAINPGIPLTRANTADLSAPDTLVLASEEPMQSQEAILLRPAAQYGETHEEQLLRASVGGGEE